MILPRGWRGRFLIFGGRCPGGLLTCGPTCQCFTKPIRVPHEAEQRQKKHVVNLKKMREKRIQQRVKWCLLRPCFCDLTPHCFVICDRRDRGVDSVLYIVLHASKHGRKRRDVAFFYSFNQSIRELRFHLFGFGNTVHNGSHDAKSYFHIWLHIVDALNRTTWFCSCVLSIQISIILI